MFGPHLLLEASGCDRARLSNISLLIDLLEDLPDKMHMTKIAPPYAFKYKGTVQEDDGLSGIVLIAESHVAIHTFPQKGFVTVDIFSCKEFDVRMATEMIVEAFNPTSWDEQLLMRGREFPRSVSRAGSILESERKQHFSQLVAA